jgi:hypothetical protein
MFLLAFAAFFGVFYAFERGQSSGASAAQRQLAAPPHVGGVGRVGLAYAPAPNPNPRAPSPLAVFNACIKMRRTPPAIVVQCAIAEAQLLGCTELANKIAAVFGPRRPIIDVPPAPPVSPIDHANEALKLVSVLETAPGAPQVPGIQIEAATSSVDDSIPSPIDGVPSGGWQALCGALAREAPTFATPKHVGMFRQNRARLEQLGIDPEKIAGQPAMQYEAHCADMVDAHQSIVDNGIADGFVGATVHVPHPTQPELGQDVEVTLSGVLGLAQVAGLEGAMGWLEDVGDRKRYPHTTRAFLATNGAF